MWCEGEGKRKVEINAKDTAENKPPRLCHLLDVRFMGERKSSCLRFQIWPTRRIGDAMNQNKEVSRMWGKCIAGF